MKLNITGLDIRYTQFINNRSRTTSDIYTNKIYNPYYNLPYSGRTKYYLQRWAIYAELARKLFPEANKILGLV